MRTYLATLALAQVALAERTEFFDFEVTLAGHTEPITIGALTNGKFATIVTNVASQ